MKGKVKESDTPRERGHMTTQPRDNRGRKLIPLFPVLQAIRDAAGATGGARFAAVLSRVGLAQPTLVTAVEDLAQRGLIAVDRKSWALSLTEAGHAELPPVGSDSRRSRSNRRGGVT